MARASGVDMNPMTVTQRASAFSAAATSSGTVTLVVQRSDIGLQGYLVAPSGSVSSQAATHLAQAVGARAELRDLPLDLSGAEAVGWLSYQSGSTVTRETQSGIDPTEVSRLLANTLPRGSWVAIVLRAPSRAERKRAKSWLAYRLSTAVPQHHSMASEAVVVSVLAGAEDKAAVKHLLRQVHAVLPGFDVTTKARVASRVRAGAGWVAAGVGVTAASLGAGSVVDMPGPSYLTLAGIAAVVFGALRTAGITGSSYTRIRAAVQRVDFAPPAKRHGRPKPPRPERTTAEKHEEGFEGEYPLAGSSFLLGPQVVIGMVAPQAGAVSGEASTKARSVPPKMLERIGPMIGDAVDGQVHISVADHRYGVAVLGKAGSGKSKLLNALFAWSCLERVTPSGLDGFPGRDNTLVAFESKGDGVEPYRAWAQTTGDDLTLVDMADASSYAIDMFAVPGSSAERANFIVNAMVYAFGEGSIQDRSFESLLAVFTAALAVTPDLAGQVPDLDAGGSPVYFAHVLLGGRGDQLGVNLAQEMMAEAARQPEATDLAEAATGLGPLYQGKSEAARRQLVEAPRNKLAQLMAFEQWWSPKRPKLTWDNVLGQHRAVVINTGTSADGNLVDERLGQQMSSLLMYSLRHAIMRRCGGWLEQGRSVSIFSDELSLLSGHSPEVLTWLRDQGRSFGVRPFLATQRPEQLPDRVRTALLTFATLVSFAQEDVSTAREVAENVSGAAEEWTAEDVQMLEPYTPVVRAGVNERRQSAFTVRIRDFEADQDGFAEAQGYQRVRIAVEHPTDEDDAPPAVEHPRMSEHGTADDTDGYFGNDTDQELMTW